MTPSSRADWLPALAVGGATVFLFLPVLAGGESFFGRDMAPFFYPMKAYLAEMLGDGRFPLWNPRTAGGGPFFATLQPAVLYPGSLPLLVLPFPRSVDWIVVLHLPFAAAGWILLLRQWGRSAPAATFGALAFVLGGFFLSIANFLNNLQTLAWAPWLFLAWARYLSTGDLRRLAVFAGVCVLAFLGGEPQLLALLLGVVFVHGLIGLEEATLSRPRQARGFLLAGGLALAAAGVQLFPFLEFLGQSVRTLPLELSFTASRSLEPWGLTHLLVPPAIEAGPHDFTTSHLLYRRVPWLLSIYPGVLVIALWVGGLRVSDRRTVLFWGALGLAGLVLALGRYSPVYTVLFEFTPLVRPFRYPEKFVLLLALGIPVLASAGLDAWAGETRRKASMGRILLVMLGAYSAVAVALAVAPALFGAWCGVAGRVLACDEPTLAASLYRDRMVAIVLALLLACAIVRLRSSGRLGPEPASWALVALAALELGLAHRSLNPTADSEVYTTPPWAATVLAEKWDRRDEYRFRGTPLAAAMGNTVQVRGAADLSNMYLDLQTMGPNAGQLFGFLQQDGLQGVELQSVAMTHDAAINRWATDPIRFLRAMNVRYYADATPHADSIAGLAEIARHPELPVRLFEVPDPLPRAFVASRWTVAEGPGPALQRALAGADPLRQEVVLERPPPDLSSTPAGSARGRIVAATWEAERVRLVVQSSGAALLVLLDRWYPGWEATVNGAEAEVLRANGVFRAVPIAGGVSDVEFRFRPSSVSLGALASLLGLTGLVLLYATGRKARSA